jgi:hypothetical protein
MDNTTVNHNLNHNVNILRRKMVSIGILRDFSHPETIKYSEALDKLIVCVQRHNANQ